MNIATNDKQLAERAAKLSPLCQSIRELEAKEVEAKTGLAWIAVQLGQSYASAQVAWLGSKGEEKLWREWIQKHSSNSLRTIQVYMQVAEFWEAADEAQRSALLARGSIVGLLEAVRGTVGETAKSSPVWLSICDSVEKWRDKYLAHAGEFTVEGKEKLRADILPIASELWPDNFAVKQVVQD